MINISYEPYEVESHLNCDNETKKWSAYVCQQSVISKFRRAGFTPSKVDASGAHYYANIPFECISIRSDRSQKPKDENKPKRTMSDEHKAKLMAARKNKQK